MSFIYNIIKKLFLGIDFDDSEILNEAIIDDNENLQDNLENQQQQPITQKKSTFDYLKLALISSLTLISIIILVKFLNYNPNLEELQNLLTELATTVDWDLYRDIFLNIQKLLSFSANKNTTLYVLKEIHSFFLSNTNQVKDTEKFDRIMKEIIAFLDDIY